MHLKLRYIFKKFSNKRTWSILFIYALISIIGSLSIFIIQESEDILGKNKMFLLISTMVLVVGVALSLLFILVYVKDNKPFQYWISFSEKKKNIYLRLLLLEFLKIFLILIILTIITLAFVFAILNEMVIYEKVEKEKEIIYIPWHRDDEPKTMNDISNSMSLNTRSENVIDPIEYEIKEKIIMHPVTEFLFFNNYAYILWNFNWLLSLLVCYLFHWTVPFYKHKTIIPYNFSLN
ncbi:hypothetical protein [Mycoplasma sp. E35C]|uniref:hypothetical protein n=1 Tax=Mycoplasma sp. E35C TaxID=2801918 RepID=UPI001CA439B7|nr:hypothetical protein [Mycoplasma sp. E35C]QZX48962.1 hypothetical protein JJE79_02805 [Mycoplasma sp. E35C]